jgi:SAM-dependent methyltransferase
MSDGPGNMGPPSPTYSAEFFAQNATGMRRSADVTVPLVMRLLSPTSVVDLGCGVGAWLAAFSRNGVSDILGYDGPWVDSARLEIPADAFVACDLSQPVEVNRSFDLAVSLEVAEHLPERAAQTFVKSLTSLAPAVLFSAAIPEQDGTQHVNLQWPHYWRDLFLAEGFVAVDCIRHQVWSDPDVEFWYRQNMLLFVRGDVLAANELLSAEARVPRPIDVVHPMHWQQVTHQARIDRDALTAVRAELAEAHALLQRPWTVRRVVGGLWHRISR